LPRCEGYIPKNLLREGALECSMYPATCFLQAGRYLTKATYWTTEQCGRGDHRYPCLFFGFRYSYEQYLAPPERELQFFWFFTWGLDIFCKILDYINGFLRCRCGVLPSQRGEASSDAPTLSVVRTAGLS